MATTPHGCITRPLEIFRTMLSYCPSFQLWVEQTDGDIPASGSARAAFCLDYIHYATYNKPASGFVYPAAIVEVPVDVDFDAIAVDTHNTGTGVVDCLVVRDIPEALEYDEWAAYMDFSGVDTDGVATGLGAIISDLLEVKSTAPEAFENIEISLVDGPYFCSESKRSADAGFMAARLRIRWGI